MITCENCKTELHIEDSIQYSNLYFCGFYCIGEWEDGFTKKELPAVKPNEEQRHAILRVLEEEMDLEDIAEALNKAGHEATYVVVKPWVKQVIWQLVDEGVLEFTLDWKVRKK